MNIFPHFFINFYIASFTYTHVRSNLQVVVQYDKDLLEVWDEAKRLRCEWFNDYEKTASKPPMVIADLDVIQLDFRGKIRLKKTFISFTDLISMFCLCSIFRR